MSLTSRSGPGSLPAPFGGCQQGAPAVRRDDDSRRADVGPLFWWRKPSGGPGSPASTQMRCCRGSHGVVDPDNPANASFRGEHAHPRPTPPRHLPVEADKSGGGSRLTAVAAPACRLWWARGPADLRHRERVRRHVHVQGPAPALARRGGPLPVPQGRLAGGAAATSSCATARGSTSTSAATRSTQPPSATTSSTWSPTTRRGSGSSRGCSSTPSGGSTRRASPATSTCSRTTPTRPATPTAATRTTSSAGTVSSARSPTC